MGFFNKLLKFSLCAVFVPLVAFGAAAPNMRGATGRNTSVGAKNPDAESSASIRRAATSVIARSVAQNDRKNRTVVNARPAIARVATNRTMTGRGGEKATNVSRVAVNKAPKVRSATNNASGVRSGANTSRAGVARATAVFNDVSKIGGGYAGCRDSYATCMDQFCANANDAFRRCYCSDRIADFRKTSDSLDTVLTMLADFQNTNLDAVDKTAAEISAMYSASEGEAAIKRDTSASQKLLDNISDLLSGKKSSSSYKSSYANSTSGTSMGILDLSGMFSSSGDDGDIWGGSSSISNVFDFGTSSRYTNMADMEGGELYAAANRQCSAIARNECSGDAVFNLARSAYSIMITQDCNVYEKNINAKRESVQNTVRTAEKYLREARLEEYRAHNSADVNACLDAVESAIRRPTACGENYEKCLDYSGLYINNVTGEPVYSKALFNLNNLITLDGSSDVLSKNSDFNNFLEEKKIYADVALDSCRGIADTVWYEFKRGAIIQIAQAQDAKIQEVKDSCVQTMKNCYDQQTGALDELGGESIAKMTGAISAVAAHDMCRDQVLACAALYGDIDGCVYDDATKTLKQKSGSKCGLESLLAYVSTVDSVRAAQGCETSLREYARELCADEENEYPWKCRLMTKSNIKSALNIRANLVCAKDIIDEINTNNAKVDEEGNTKVSFDMKATVLGDPVTIIADSIENELQAQLGEECYAIKDEGQLFWATSPDGINDKETIRISSGWLKTVFGSDTNAKTDLQDKENVRGYSYQVYGGSEQSFSIDPSKYTGNRFGRGICMKPTEKQICSMQLAIPGMDKSYVSYNETTGKCNIEKDNWYTIRCKQIDGYMYNNQCYIR